MREKELRIALVCCGGVSLAVYMHGITKEILKLVRASAALHRIADRPARAKAAARQHRLIAAILCPGHGAAFPRLLRLNRCRCTGVASRTFLVCLRAFQNQRFS